MSNNYYFKHLMKDLPGNRCQFATAENGTATRPSGTIRRSGTTAGCRWTLAGERRKATLTLTGSGAMGHYSDRRSAPWARYAGDIGRIIIQEGVTSIGPRAFADCYNLTTLSIASSVGSIGAGAFYACTELTAVALPDSVLRVEKEVFCGCSNLRRVLLGHSVERIENYAFWGCGGLVEIRFPDTLTAIGDQAFWGCNELQEVVLPDAVTHLGFATFLYCTQLRAITIGRSVSVIGDLAFTGAVESTIEVTNHCPSPQAIRPMVFERVDLTGSTLRVPAGSVNGYRNSAVWREFGEIRGV
jgi:hypothetical protein